MLSSINFYDNLFLMTNKIYDVCPYRLLPSEFQAEKPSCFKMHHNLFCTQKKKPASPEGEAGESFCLCF